MSRKTNAIRLIEQAGVDHEVRSYEISIEDFSAEAVAELIGMDAGAVFSLTPRLTRDWSRQLVGNLDDLSDLTGRSDVSRGPPQR